MGFWWGLALGAIGALFISAGAFLGDRARLRRRMLREHLAGVEAGADLRHAIGVGKAAVAAIEASQEAYELIGGLPLCEECRLLVRHAIEPR